MPNTPMSNDLLNLNIIKPATNCPLCLTKSSVICLEDENFFQSNLKNKYGCGGRPKRFLVFT